MSIYHNAEQQRGYDDRADRHGSFSPYPYSEDYDYRKGWEERERDERQEVARREDEREREDQTERDAIRRAEAESMRQEEEYHFRQLMHEQDQPQQEPEEVPT